MFYEFVEKTTAQTTVTDVIFGAIAIVGALAVVALLLGFICAGLLIGYRRLWGRDRLAGAGSNVTQLRIKPSGSNR